jgi:hypothetical protein
MIVEDGMMRTSSAPMRTVVSVSLECLSRAPCRSAKVSRRTGGGGIKIVGDVSEELCKTGAPGKSLGLAMLRGALDGL